MVTLELLYEAPVVQDAREVLMTGLRSLLDCGLDGPLRVRAYSDLMVLERAHARISRGLTRTETRIRAFWRNRFPEFFTEVE